MEEYLLVQAQTIISLATEQPDKYKQIAYDTNFAVPDEVHSLLSKRVNLYDNWVADDRPLIELGFRVWFINQENLELSARYTVRISKFGRIFTDNFYMMLDTPIKDAFHIHSSSFSFDHCISPTNEIDNFRNTLRAALEKNKYQYAHHHTLYQYHYSFSRFFMQQPLFHSFYNLLGKLPPNYHDTFCMADLLFEDYFERYAQD
jgi:hypothetical protein